MGYYERGRHRACQLCPECDRGKVSGMREGGVVYFSCGTMIENAERRTTTSKKCRYTKERVRRELVWELEHARGKA